MFGAGASQGEAFTRIGVTVTFLAMDAPPRAPARQLPAGLSVVRVARPSVAFYRYLYETIGRDYVWWMRCVMPDAELAALLAGPDVSLHVLYGGGEPLGFYELDMRRTPEIVNIAYFGLMPQAIGAGFGTAFLRHAIDTAWAMRPQLLTVNTCTADHPRALPGYRAAGFRAVREAREIWDVPGRLGLVIPDNLRLL